MNRRQVLIGLAGGVAAFLDTRWLPGAEPDNSAIGKLRVTEPVSFQNLTVYFLLSDVRDDREFITLNEGLKKGLVKVTELENEQVNRLTIENLAAAPLFLQEGDRVTGGNQDRTVYTSLIIPPKSGKQEVPAFCVEPSRWQAGAGGKNFAANSNPTYACKNVRHASKLHSNQQVVWDNVAQSKSDLTKALGTMDKTSSLNEAQDSKKVAEATKAMVAALGKAADGHADLVGVAFAVNGKIQEVNVFPGRRISQAIYPRLLETYALDAIVVAKEADAKDKAPTRDQVLALLRTELKEKPDRDEKINADNQLNIYGAKAASADKKTRVYRCQTDYAGKPVHLQWIVGPEAIEAPRPQFQNNIQQQQRGLQVQPNRNP